MQIPEWFLSLPRELVIPLTAALPIFELRISIPLGVSMGLPLKQVYLLSLLGNIVPVIPLLILLKHSFYKLEKIKFVGGFFRWWFAHVEKKSNVIEKWGFWGLVFFVAVPLPGTGAWAGSVAATLVEMRMRKAFLAIFLGVAIAGVAVSLLTSGIAKLWFTAT